jgi:hypothetical protein
MADPCLAGLARTLFDVVGENLPAVTAEAGHLAQLEEFRARYVTRGASPGDDLPRRYDLRAAGMIAAGLTAAGAA